jgi:hypothetical protein
MPGKLNPADKHDKRITVRLTADEYRNIEEEAGRCRLPTAVYARHLILGRQVTFTNPIVLDARGIEPAIAALGRIGNNVNQIARWLNRHASMDDALRAEASSTFKEVASCARLLTELATRGVLRSI